MTSLGWLSALEWGQVAGWGLELLILTVGIYLFLRFVRNTRGSLLIRGLFISLIFGVVGLWGLSEALQLEELQHMIKGVTGFVAVIFVILFQPELRRGIAQLGESKLMGRIMRKFRPDTVSEVAKAARSMAERRQGALITISRSSARPRSTPTSRAACRWTPRSGACCSRASSTPAGRCTTAR
jgi:DNA integrity scanning protein DisA with diadenylate cyclase activity